MATATSKCKCPRCGYDQSGAIAAWERNVPACCPLSGTCTECGLEFTWRNLLNPTYMRLEQMFEHAKRRRVESFLLTVWKSLRPWALWRWIKIEFSINRPRLILFVVLAIALSAAASLGLVFGARAGHRWIEDAWTGRFFLNFAWSDRFSLSMLTREPLTIIFDKGSPWPAPWVVVLVLATLIAPWTYALLQATLRRAKVRRMHLLRIWVYGLAWFPLLVMAPAAAAVLADSAMAIDLQLHGTGYWLSGLGVWLDKHRYAPGLALVFIWLTLWWGFASSRYLRLPHGLAIGLCMAFISMLLSVALVALVPGGAHWMLWGL